MLCGCCTWFKQKMMSQADCGGEGRCVDMTYLLMRMLLLLLVTKTWVLGNSSSTNTTTDVGTWGGWSKRLLKGAKLLSGLDLLLLHVVVVVGAGRRVVVRVIYRVRDKGSLVATGLLADMTGHQAVRLSIKTIWLRSSGASSTTTAPTTTTPSTSRRWRCLLCPFRMFTSWGPCPGWLYWICRLIVMSWMHTTTNMLTATTRVVDIINLTYLRWLLMFSSSLWLLLLLYLTLILGGTLPIALTRDSCRLGDVNVTREVRCEVGGSCWDLGLRLVCWVCQVYVIKLKGIGGGSSLLLELLYFTVFQVVPLVALDNMGDKWTLNGKK